MTGMLLVTPTYSPDRALCQALVDSVRAFVSSDIEHLVLPDARDLAGFRRLAGDQIRVIAKEEFLPHGFHRVPRRNAWFHPRLRRPVGGWLMQQLVKLNAARVLDARCLVFVDSDVAFVRPVTEATFVADGAVRTYRLPGGITSDLASHIEWSSAAADLLGIELASVPLPDYISQLVSWDGSQARDMLDRIEATAGRPWYLTVAARRKVSEYLLYGSWVDRAGAPEPLWSEPTSLCHSYWEQDSMSSDAADSFVASFPADYVAVGMQSWSATDPRVREDVIRRLSDGVLF